jgi:hypothetical protein
MVGSEAVVIWGFLGFLDGVGLDASSSMMVFLFGMSVMVMMQDFGEVKFEMTRV